MHDLYNYLKLCLSITLAAMYSHLRSYHNNNKAIYIIILDAIYNIYIRCYIYILDAIY